MKNEVTPYEYGLTCKEDSSGVHICEIGDPNFAMCGYCIGSVFATRIKKEIPNHHICGDCLKELKRRKER